MADYVKRQHRHPAAVSPASPASSFQNRPFSPSPSPAVRRKSVVTPESVLQVAAEGTMGSGAGLPHQEEIQRSFGKHDLGRVRVFSDPPAQRSAAELGANAYTYGDRVAFATAAPSLRTAAHEAAHVVQQRQGVHLEGGIGRRGDRFERNADQVADRVVQGRSAETLLDQVAPSASTRAVRQEPQAVQGDIGLEIELPAPIVEEDGSNISGEQTLGRIPGVKIVTDHNSALTGKALNGGQVACVEVVMDHVSEAEEGGVAEIQGRLQAIGFLIEDLNKALAARDETPWTDFWGGGEDYKLTRNVTGGKLGQDVGYVQFTVGVAASAVPQLLESMESLGAPTQGATAKSKAGPIQAEAEAFAASVMTQASMLPPHAQRDLQGYLILSYMLAGGLFNGMRDKTLEEYEVVPETGGVMKNYASLLPRMSPSQMFATLDETTQAFVVKQGKNIVSELKGQMLAFRQVTESPFSKAIAKQVKKKFQDPASLLDVSAIKNLIASVGNPEISVDISSSKLFGKMAIAETPDRVSPHLQGIPVEIRHHSDKMSGGTKNQMTRKEWEAAALIWYRRTLLNVHSAEESQRAKEGVF